MKISIKQKAITFTDEYEIFVDEKLNFTAKSQAFKKSAKIDFLNADSNAQILKIAKRNFGIRANYLIENQYDGEMYFFEEVNNIKLIFKCKIKEDLFQLYGHNGNRYSIFKNQIQIGYWEKNYFIFGEKDFYNLTVNNDENPIFLAAFAICTDNAKNNSQNELNSFNFDIGFKGNLLREFDANWKPKI